MPRSAASLNPHHPGIRLTIGDVTAVLPDSSTTGHTNLRIKGWMGRPDQTAKVKGTSSALNRWPRSERVIPNWDDCG